MKVDPLTLIGKVFMAADGGNYGIFVISYLEEVDDLVVINTIGKKIDYSQENKIHRLDVFKASYRYVLDEPFEKENRKS
jgi:hypothetical protein